MTADNLEAMSETNAATAPRKNVGAIACEKIWDKRSASGIKSNIPGSHLIGQSPLDSDYRDHGSSTARNPSMIDVEALLC
jgi:hypothetical protein